MIHSYFPNAGAARLDHLAKVDAAFAGLDLAGKHLAEPRAALAHARHLDQAAKQRPAAIADQAATVADQLAAGQLTVDQAVEHVAGQQAHAAAVDQVRATLRRAAALALDAARAAFAANGDALIAALDTEARRIARDAEHLAPAVDGITDDRAAVTAGGRTAKAWSDLAALAARLGEVQTLADTLRTYRIARVERHDGMTPVPAELHYTHPVIAEQVRKQRHVHPVAALIATLPAEPRELNMSGWVDDWDRLSDEYDDEVARQDGEDVKQHRAQRHAAAVRLAQLDERARQRDAAA